MFTKITLKLVYSYTERALTPNIYSTLLQSTVKSQSLSQIMHNLNLYYHNINVFDYDYYNKSCYTLLDYQRKMSVSQIITVLKLGIRHEVKNQLIWKHMEAQLYNRLHQRMSKVFELQNIQQQNQIKKWIEEYQKNSQDQFGILTDQFKKQQLKVAQKQQEQTKTELQHQPNQQPKKQQIKQQKQLQTKKKKEDITKFAFQLVQILIWYGSQHLQLLNYLLQTQLHPSVIQYTPFASLRLAQLLTYICQTNMKIYQTNKKMYTARSIKKIYKYQGQYIPQLVQNLKKTLGMFSVEDIKYLTQVLRSFPIKKRAHRQSITTLIREQCKNRGVAVLQQQKFKLQQILAKDQKLIKKFNSSFGIQQLEQKKQQMLETGDRKEQNKEERKEQITN